MTAARKPGLAFVSPLFLFPNDAGGKIRSTNILRGLKGGAFRILLLSPATAAQRTRWAPEIDGVCDEFVPWAPQPALPRWRRAFDLLGELPVNVAADRSAAAAAAVQAAAARSDVDLLVFDFVHSAVLMPAALQRPSVCFTHNVEAEIFARHAQRATDPARRWLWTSQRDKMVRFERTSLRRFSRVVAVSDRDAAHFGDAYGVTSAQSIPTGVDLDYFAWQEPAPLDAAHPPTVVFTGSMDWAANIDGVSRFIREVWPLVRRAVPAARFVVVGRNPPPALQALAGEGSGVEFTGFVDDVRPHVHRSHVFVIPLWVGGGTRIKAFEAMAMGCPVVSTSIGIEGLGAEADRHYARGDEPRTMADAIVRLLADASARRPLAERARALVEQRFGHRVAAAAFERICEQALQEQPRPAAPATGVHGNAGAAAVLAEPAA